MSAAPCPAVEDIRRRIAEAAERAGRDAHAVRIVAASKTRAAEEIAALASCGGIAAFGENRIQEALPKIANLGCDAFHWHFIGRLQRNKVKDCGAFELLHSVDSEALIDAVAERVPHVAVLLQVNVSGEATKGGFEPEDSERALRRALGRGLSVRGLMTMAPHGDPGGARDCFRGLAVVRDSIAATVGVPLTELSMGMTDDFDIAVEEGATLLRIGRALFGERPGQA